MRTTIIVLFTLVIGVPPLSAEILEFDGAGNLIRNGQRSMVYNSQNKTVAVSGEAGTGDYVYKDSGSRLRKRFSLASNPGQTTELINPTRLMTQQAKPGARRGLVNHIYLNGVRLAAMGPNAAGQPAIRYYHTDQVSSVKLVTDGKADVGERHEYLPYGGEFASPPLHIVGKGPGGGVPKFNSQEHDKESGLDFFNARHYDSKLAHFTSADTVVDGEDKSAGWNRYMFVHGNPVTYADPSGNVIELILPIMAGGSIIGTEHISGTTETLMDRMRPYWRTAKRSDNFEKVVESLNSSKNKVVINFSLSKPKEGFHATAHGLTYRKNGITHSDIFLQSSLTEIDRFNCTVHEMIHATQFEEDNHVNPELKAYLGAAVATWQAFPKRKRGDDFKIDEPIYQAAKFDADFGNKTSITRQDVLNEIKRLETFAQNMPEYHQLSLGRIDQNRYDYHYLDAESLADFQKYHDRRLAMRQASRQRILSQQQAANRQTKLKFLAAGTAGLASLAGFLYWYTGGKL